MEVTHHYVALKGLLRSKKRVAFVPTMGNLHAGHLHLVEVAKRHADCVVVSIFVNPLQFGPNEDLDRYPRTLAQDCEKLEAAGADIVFAPEVVEVYPGFDGHALNQTMSIQLPPIADELCGASRPGHFAGVATVVTKLFNMVQPNVAVFGKKDYQQLYIIKKMVSQFNMPVEIIAGDIIREPGGLAMSSRNNLLTNEQKAQALQLHITLREVVEAIKLGKDDFNTIEQTAMQRLADKGWQVDYISIRAAQSLKPIQSTKADLVILGAATLGKTRLIDNIEFCAKPLN